MSLGQNLKTFFNKEKFDYSQTQINPYEFHKTFYYLTKAFGVFDIEPIPKWTTMVRLETCFVGVVGALMSCMAMIRAFGIFDVPRITESGTYVIILVYKVLIISCTIRDGPYYHNLLQAMRDDFDNITSKGENYRRKFFLNQVWTWKASIVSSVFTGIIGGSIVICAIIAWFFCLFYPTKNGIRPLPFPFEITGVDNQISPVNEFIFVFSILCAISHVCTLVFMMQTQIVWIRQIMSKADVIIWSIEDLLVDVKPTNNLEQIQHFNIVIKTRMREIIEMHHSMYRLLDDYAGVYKKLLMFEQKACAPVVTLTAYASAEKIDAGEFPGILLLLCLSVIILAFIPSYMCTVLAEKVHSIGDACWNTSFWNAPAKVIRPYLILIMKRSLRPLPIQTPGFEDVSLQTFSNKLTFAYSCFNVLRQNDYKV